MKISEAGKRLGAHANAYEIVLEGEGTLPMISTPGGRILRLQQLVRGGKWEASSMEPADTKFFVEAANLLREKNREEMRRLAEQEAAEGDPTVGPV